MVKYWNYDKKGRLIKEKIEKKATKIFPFKKTREWNWGKIRNSFKVFARKMKKLNLDIFEI